MRETAGRNAPQVDALRKYSAEENLDLRTLELDVTSQAPAEAAVSTIIQDARRLDVVVHNAGHMAFGPAESFTPEQFAQLYDVNVLGAQRVNRAALPQLRRQGRGPTCLGFVHQRAWRDAAVSGSLFRCQGGDGLSGGELFR